MQQRFPPVFLLSVCLICASPVLSHASDEVERGPAPDWVEPFDTDFEPEATGAAASVGSHHLLLDLQNNTRCQELYEHHAYRILNREAVENISDVVVEFIPSYQTLSFHFIRILRDGQSIDKLTDHEIQTYQRETNLEWGIYTGATTAVVNLRDVRPGDVLEYAYTTAGVNPLLADHLVLGFSQRADFPVQEIRVRYIVDPERTLFAKNANGARPMQTQSTALGTEYRWREHDIPSVPVDSNIPPWFDPHPHVTLTSFADWKAVVDWALPLYELGDADRAAAARLFETTLTGDSWQERTLAAIRFVQDEVRYLGRFDGLWALQPRPPASCLEDRFGDCKEKSLLLVGLLRHLDLEAYPVLVSSYRGPQIIEDSPSPHAFDHCVVGVVLPKGTFYIDPTLAQQGGGLDAHHFPDYRYGLPISEGSPGLAELPEPGPLPVEVVEEYEVLAVGEGDVRFEVNTRYHGKMADSQRELFATRSIEDITQGNVRYYSRSWPGIAETGPTKFLDEDREGTNLFEVWESYLIRDAWTPCLTDTGCFQLEFYPLFLEQFVGFPASPARTMPYYAGEAIELSHRSTIVMPRDWDFSLDPIKRSDPAIGIEFESRDYNEGSVVHTDYTYSCRMKSIPPQAAGRFISLHNQILQELGITLYDSGTEPFRSSARAWAVFLAALIGGGVVSILIWKRYDPAPAETVEAPWNIGGWLYLVGFGVVIRPVIFLGEFLSDQSSFDRSTWDLAGTDLIDLAPGRWHALLAFEQAGSALGFIFSLLVLFLFFRKRSSLPRALFLYLAAMAIYITADSVTALSILGEFMEIGESIGDIFGAWVALMIWGPYLLTSERVRKTFVRQLRPAPRVEVETARPEVAAEGGQEDVSPPDEI